MANINPQSSLQMPASVVFCRLVLADKQWSLMSRKWLGIIFQQGTIVRDAISQNYFLSMGHIADLVVMAWQVEMFDFMSGPPSDRKLTKPFAVGTDAVDNYQAHLINPISMDDYDAIPTKIVSPIHLWLATGRRVHAKSGIVLLQDGDEMPLMELAARNCFYNLPLYR